MVSFLPRIVHYKARRGRGKQILVTYSIPTSVPLLSPFHFVLRVAYTFTTVLCFGPQVHPPETELVLQEKFCFSVVAILDELKLGAARCLSRMRGVRGRLDCESHMQTR